MARLKVLTVLCCKQEDGRPPTSRPTLPPVELRGGKFCASTSMMRTVDAQLGRRLEDITGPIDPQQVQKPPSSRSALSPASNHLVCALGTGPRAGQKWSRRDKRLRTISVERFPF